MSKNESSSSYLPHFSWEEWDQQMIVVLYRSDRRFVVKRYIERVLANSSEWQKLAHACFSKIEPIPRAYSMTEKEVKLMHQIFSWHFNGTLKFPIIAGLDQVLDWEDLLDFVERAEKFWADHQQEESPGTKSPSLVPTIPVGILPPPSKGKKLVEKQNSSDQVPQRKHEVTPMKSNQKTDRSRRMYDENNATSAGNHWVQIDNICVPYIIKSQQTRLLPYQVILDCDLLNHEEDQFLRHFTLAANANDIQTFERIIASSSSIEFRLAQDLLLIDLYHLIFGMSKVSYVKLLQQHKDVNKSYKTVLAHYGGTIRFRSYSIPFIRLGKVDYILFESLVSIIQPPSKLLTTLRRRTAPAQSHEIDYLRLVQFYQRKYHQDDDILLNQSEQQFLISIKEIQKHMDDIDLMLDTTLSEYQQIEHKTLNNEIAMLDAQKGTVRKATKRKAITAVTELKNMRMEKA